MPKKRVGVTLRKPSPAPDGAAAAAVATADAVEPASIPAPVGPQSSDAAGELHDVLVAPLAASTAEAFVNGAAAALEKAAAQLPPARLRELIERGREGYRELVLYLPEKLAQKLALYCNERDVDMSRVVATAIEQHLERLQGEQNRRADDPRRSTRQIVLELAEWVRALWATRPKWVARPADAAVS